MKVELRVRLTGSTIYCMVLVKFLILLSLIPSFVKIEIIVVLKYGLLGEPTNAICLCMDLKLFWTKMSLLFLRGGLFYRL